MGRGLENRGFKMMGWRVLVALALALLAGGSALAASAQDGVAALHREDYAKALAILGPLGKSGNATAQTYLGYMYANGYGLPQNYIEAANWLRLASEQGFPEAQYLLGLMYNKGQGVPQDYVEAYKWLDLAVAQAHGRQRDDWVRIRNAVATKLSLADRTRAQALVMAWFARRAR
jgi:uncharacterized protein